MAELHSLPPATVIISTRNRPELISDAVRSILAGDSLPAELIVIDQSDTRHPGLDRIEVKERTEFRYVWTRERGLSRGRNMGIRAARHSIVVFIDDDCLVEPDWFETLVTALVRAGRRFVVTGRVAPGDDETAGAFAPSVIMDDRPATYVGRINRDVLYPNNMALFRDVVEDVGFFDPRLGPGSRFASSDDNDFGFRLLEARYRIRYVPEAIVKHRAWRGTAAFLPLRWAYGRGQGAYFTKHLNASRHYMLRRLVFSFWEHLWRIRRLPTGPKAAAGNFVYVLAMLGGSLEWLLTQRRRAGVVGR